MKRKRMTSTPSMYDGPHKSSKKQIRTQEERAAKKEEKGELQVQFPRFGRAGGNWHRLS